MTITTTTLTYNSEAGTNYYYEWNGVPSMHVGGADYVTPNNTGLTGQRTFNFGQQPFIGGVDSSKTWSSEGVFSGSGTSDPNTLAFDGNLNTKVTTTASGGDRDRTLKFTFNNPIALANQTVAVFTHSTYSTFIPYIDGVAQTEIEGKPENFIEAGPFTGNLTAVEVTNGPDTSDRPATMCAIYIDRKILVDPNAEIVNAVDTGLYQTWEEWARTALGYLEDRIAYLEEARKQDEATIAELRNQVEQALARIGSLEADEINDDAVDTVLVNAVADLIARVEVLEAE